MQARWSCAAALLASATPRRTASCWCTGGERLGPPATFNPNTGAGYVLPKEGDYARAEALGVRVVLMLVETFGGLGPALVEELRKGPEWRANKLTASEYDETTWSARTWMALRRSASRWRCAVLGRAGGGRGARPVGGGRPTSAVERRPRWAARGVKLGEPWGTRVSSHRDYDGLCVCAASHVWSTFCSRALYRGRE
eukprot:scaffold2815_cov72-Phaeocystis_antarctica.AAC.2